MKSNYLNITLNEKTYKYDKKSKETILDFLLSNKEEVAYQCRDGFCGVCRCQLLKGKVDEDKNAIGFKNKDEILICSSFPTSDVVVFKK